MKMLSKWNGMRLTWQAMIVMPLLLSGCATAIPQARNFAPSEQKKVMAAKHWEMIAADAVEQTRLALQSPRFDGNKPVYVTENGKADFDRAFRKYMISGFIDAGMPVSTKKEGAIEVSYETQVIRHANAQNPEALGYQPGMATVGVSGFWVLRNAISKWSTRSAGIASVAAAGAYDAYQAINPGETGVELLVSTSVVHADRYVMLKTDAYYIESGEAVLFELCSGNSRRRCRTADSVK